MDKPIIASYRWSKDEFLRAQRLAVRNSALGRWIYRLSTGIGVLILFGGVTVYMQTPNLFSFLFTVLVASFFFSMPLLARRSALKMFFQKPDRDMMVTWEISTDRVSSRTELARSENSWDFYLKVLRVPGGFLLYPNDRLFHWLPDHAFHDAADIEQLANLAKAKAKEYRKVA